MSRERGERPPRSRRWTTVALVCVIAIGLATRRAPGWFPAFVAEHAGDALWATAVYFALALVRPGMPVWATAAAALGIAFAVELSQLARPPWLEAVRDLPGMRLVLGYGFDPFDLVRYACGVGLALLVDPCVRRRV